MAVRSRGRSARGGGRPQKPVRKAARPARRAGAKRVTVARKPATRRRAARSAAPSGPLGLVLQHLDYTTHALDEVRRFYADLLGLGRADFDPKANYLMVRTGATSSLGFMPPLEGPAERWRPPREPALYLFVRDVDRAHAALTAKGVEFVQPPTDMFWGHRMAILKDPEGRTVCLAHTLKRK